MASASILPASSPAERTMKLTLMHGFLAQALISSAVKLGSSPGDNSAGSVDGYQEEHERTFRIRAVDYYMDSPSGKGNIGEVTFRTSANGAALSCTCHANPAVQMVQNDGLNLPVELMCKPRSTFASAARQANTFSYQRAPDADYHFEFTCVVPDTASSVFVHIDSGVHPENRLVDILSTDNLSALDSDLHREVQAWKIKDITHTHWTKVKPNEFDDFPSCLEHACPTPCTSSKIESELHTQPMAGFDAAHQLPASGPDAVTTACLRPATCADVTCPSGSHKHVSDSVSCKADFCFISECCSGLYMSSCGQLQSCQKSGWVKKQSMLDHSCVVCTDEVCCQPTCKTVTACENTVGWVLNPAAENATCNNGWCNDERCCLPTCETMQCAAVGMVADASKASQPCHGGVCTKAMCCTQR
eukprot:TRINITY_DN3216_c0_g5_i1.p1 TRINITY_DN3216_c0_g5~~TRINITY_DN3216_c0_g5_i1.p1  ORF type:complete len:417 (-),score=58.74 TRINITY_DN3216_c0_g5_i1:70-1320(-)